MSKIYLISGETSGDIHGSNLIKSIKKSKPAIEFRAWGGDKIQQSGVPLAIHIKETSFMGFWEVVTHLPKISRLFRFAKKDIINYQPDAVILIDYPGFNLRMARWLKSKKIPVIYYISPQIWAWKTGRIHIIKENVDLMICILPFEKEFYRRFDYEVEYVGHPLLDEIFESSNFQDKSPESPILAILPGSRLQEIKKMLPIMLEAAKRLKSFNPVIVKAPAIPLTEYHKLLKAEDHSLISEQGSLSILNSAELAAVSSGTATLEAAIIDVPQVVCYRGSELSYQIAKRLVRLKYISLVNLIMGESVVKELIQNNFNVQSLEKSLREAEENSTKIKEKYAQLRNRLGNKGASERASTKIINFLVKLNLHSNQIP